MNFNVNWNWDLIIFLYSILMVALGCLLTEGITRINHRKELYTEYRTAEELRVIIDALMKELHSVRESIQEVYDYEKQGS